jgi:transcription termination/antitermination protein NusG
LAPEERSEEENGNMFDEFEEETEIVEVKDDTTLEAEAAESSDESEMAFDDEEFDGEEEFDEIEGDEDLSDPLRAIRDVNLSPDAIFERFGLDTVAETTEEEEAKGTGQQLPELSFEDEAEVGVLPDPFADEEEKIRPDERAWFIIHCYSGYEHKVRHNLEQRIESMGMQDFIFQVVVPTVEEIELKDGKRRTVERCLYPGYLMVQMRLTDDSWYVVRNTPGVTGFVGMGNNPTPLRAEAVQRILRRMESTAPEVRATFKRGQKVRIVEGPFADFIGVVDDIDEERTKVRVLVSFFGRETPVELDFLQVERS